MNELNSYKLWTALITPFLNDGSIDFDSLKNLLENQNEAGNGLLLLGSTGESLALNLSERKKIINFAISLGLKSNLMVGVGGIDINEQKEWIQFLNDKEVHCYLLVTPLYAKPGRKGQSKWFKELLDTAKRPCMLYNVPSRTGTSLNLDTIKDLLNHENFWAIKEASGSTDRFSEYVKTAKNKLVFSGDDALLPDFTPLGAKGLVSVASNVWPKETHEYVNRCLDGKYQEQKPIWEKASNSLFIASNPIPVKYLMNQKNMIVSEKTRLPLDSEDLENPELILKEDQNIKNWYQN